MTPHKQLLIHDPENGIFGDCDRTVIACLLDLEPRDVPHWYDLDKYRVSEAQIVKRSFLEKRGMVEWLFPLSADATLEQVLSFGSQNPGRHFVVSGSSSRGVNHSVICRDGEIVWDPSPDNCGLAGPTNTGNWWVSFLGVDL